MDEVDEVCNYLFQIDFLLNFISAVEISNGKIEQNLCQIASLYLRSWLIIDLFACFPFDIISSIIVDTTSSDGSQADVGH